MPKWIDRIDRNGQAYRQWIPQSEAERKAGPPAFGPGQYCDACPICGARYVEHPVHPEIAKGLPVEAAFTYRLVHDRDRHREWAETIRGDVAGDDTLEPPTMTGPPTWAL